MVTIEAHVETVAEFANKLQYVGRYREIRRDDFKNVDGKRVQAYSSECRQNHLSSEEVAPRAGFEPATCRLTVECSTAELPGNALGAV